MSQNKFCTKLAGIGEMGINAQCTDGFRKSSICTLSCSNGLSEMGQSFEFHCREVDKKLIWVEKNGKNRKPECDVIMYAPRQPKSQSRSFSNVASRFPLFRLQKLNSGGWCNAPPHPQFGRRSKCYQNRREGFTHQFFCEFECDEGFQMVGSQQRSCPTANGNRNDWSGMPMRCVPSTPPGRLVGTSKPQYCPGMYKSDRNLNVACEQGDFENTLKCTYSCRDKDARMMRGPAQVTCNKDQSTSQLAARPVCITGICKALGNTFTGYSECTDGDRDESVCNLTCPPGYKLLGKSTLTCKGSRWSSSIPKCVPNSLYSEGTCKVQQIGTNAFGQPASAQRKRRVALDGTPVDGALSAFQVAIYQGEKFKCGGTLISDFWVLTAAHCLRGGNLKVYGNVKFNSSPHLGDDLGVEVALMHPEYHNLSQFDIGLIKLKNKIAMFNAMEDLACLPPKDYQPSSASVAIYGYGSTDVVERIFPQQLQQGLLMYYPHTQCGYIKKRNNADNLFCARGASAACQVH